MDDWLRLSLLLSVFGFLKEIRPSEPYFYDFLIGDWRDVTSDQVNREVFPVGTYAYLVQLVIVFLIADFLRYKPLIILVGFCGIAIWSFMLWTTSLLALQISQVIFALYTAADIAYYPYIYAKVDREHYPKASSYARTAVFCGNFLGSTIGQILIAYKLMDYRELNYITLATQIAATAWSFSLPAVKPSLYFHQQPEVTMDPSTSNVSSKDLKTSIKNAFSLLSTHFKHAYSNPKVLQWSVWYSCGLCGTLIVLEYRQMLWDEIDNSDEIVWNGAVEAVLKLLCAITTFVVGHFYSKTFVQRRGLLILSLISYLQSGLILLMCLPESRWISYLGYLLFNVAFTILITVATVEIGRHLVDESFGLVFGINTFFAILLETILTIVFISKSGFQLSLIDQYKTFAAYFFCLASAFMTYIVIKCARDF